MKNSLLNYQFFKSYRLPLNPKDKVMANISSQQREGKQSLNVKIESMNLSGLNFITSSKFNIGEDIDIYLFTDKLFNNWDFHLKGKVVRSFVYEKDIEKIVYGVILEKQHAESVLNYFLKDFLSKFNTNRLKEHLYRASTLDRKLISTEGVELFSLFHSITQDIYKEGIDHFLKDLPKAMGCEFYHLYLIDESKKKLKQYKSNCDVDILKTEHRNIIELSYENEMLSNMVLKNSEDNAENSDDKKLHNILCFPIHNRLQVPIGVISLTNTLRQTPFDAFNETSLRLMSQILSSFFSDYFCSLNHINNKDHHVSYDNLTGHSRISLELKHTLDLLKNNNKSVMILGEKGTNKIELADYLHHEGKFRNDPVKHLIFDTLESTEQFFDDITNQEMESSGTIVLKEVSGLNHHQQSMLYDYLKNQKSRIITLSSNELYFLVKTGKFLKKLYFLLSDIYIHIPPLRNRKNDLVEIAECMLQEELKKRGLEPKEYADETISQIIQYHWPRNIRELRNEVKKSIIRSQNKEKVYFNVSIKKESTIPEKNNFLFKLMKSLVYHSDQSVHYKGHTESLTHFLKNKNAS